MALDPEPHDVVLLGKAVEHLPEIGVFYGFLVGCFPAVTFPVVNPLADTFLHVLGISVQMYLDRAFERFQRTDDSSEFHAVVRCVGFATPKFLFSCSRLQERSPAARSRIATAAAIGVNMGDQFMSHVVQFPCVLPS